MENCLFPFQNPSCPLVHCLYIYQTKLLKESLSSCYSHTRLKRGLFVAAATTVARVHSTSLFQGGKQSNIVGNLAFRSDIGKNWFLCNSHVLVEGVDFENCIIEPTHVILQGFSVPLFNSYQFRSSFPAQPYAGKLCGKKGMEVIIEVFRPIICFELRNFEASGIRFQCDVGVQRMRWRLLSWGYVRLALRLTKDDQHEGTYLGFEVEAEVEGWWGVDLVQGVEIDFQLELIEC
ncbi:hypothetical protein SLEP1_g49324 [Rubroshorea leprosula]|uniref:Uncharacterized protein n=1 Tax=Rubroshorea leprosula TaxID=152421 RepID=A0AAV5LWI3_9ROSI|nr:hypothetical protein SLEP1_g49324 [Rubroshorea leprosula]